jgi:hypothetical protein
MFKQVTLQVVWIPGNVLTSYDGVHSSSQTTNTGL